MRQPPCIVIFYFFFFNDTATTEIYTLSLHDALPISYMREMYDMYGSPGFLAAYNAGPNRLRSEEQTSELQSPYDLVCRLLLAKIPSTTGHAANSRKDSRPFNNALASFLFRRITLFFFTDPPSPEISALPLQDALPF